jgi:hypothetical protein
LLGRHSFLFALALRVVHLKVCMLWRTL